MNSKIVVIKRVLFSGKKKISLLEFPKISFMVVGFLGVILYCRPMPLRLYYRAVLRWKNHLIDHQIPK